ncbi:MAG: hypothetical protein JNK17_11155 [Hydrogenophaga sp.]|uniref:cytochrome oxidase putative small subunit CydP n=1 Tax=Hydrogenophaga sp. TaxID=1904254 RepID=UPI001A40C2D7|nr:hypothetical protein [Hydrogenophaga sp.]
MTRPTLSLPRKLAIVLVIKTVFLVGLWWGFVRDLRAPVDTDSAAARLLGPPPASNPSEE